MKICRLALVILLAVPSLHAATYYVAPPASGGLDTNPGTLALPYATIQRAANVAVAGDTVLIRTGTYRETITPANSGTIGARIIYQNYNNEVVTISGADVISSGSWSLDAGNIYKAPLASGFFTSTMNQATQVFVDGVMVTLAKWPNTTTKTNAYPTGIAPPVTISTPAKSTINSFVSKSRAANMTTGVVTDTDLPARPAGFYDGAEIFFQPNNGGWSWAFSGTVASVPTNSNQITFTSRNDSGQDGSGNLYQVGSRYYFFNKKEFLDIAGEWWHDKISGQLFLWTPTSANPTTRLVEVKKRDYAFNLSSRNYTTIQGLNLFACTITTDTAAGGSCLGYDASGNVIYPWRGAGSTAPSTGVILDSLNAKYLNHFTDISGHFFMQWGTGSGIVLGGTGHILRNSVIQFSAGNGVELQGTGHTVFNNTFTDVAYCGNDAAAINTVTPGPSTNHEIAYNTIRRVGRSGITPRAFSNSNAAGGQFLARIHHNDIANFGLQDWDVGGIYTAAGDGKFARIDHNLISEGIGYTASGVYLDYERNWIVDHNVVWNVEWGIKFQGHSGNVNNMLTYNNTSSVRNTSGVSFGPFAIGNGSGNNNGTVLRNNILSCFTPPVANGYQSIGSGAGAFSGAEIANNLAWNGVANSPTDPKFVNRADILDDTGVDYTIQAGSAAINAGSVISSYTRDGFVVPPFPDFVQGAPDAGAYELGSPRWIAGANLTRCAEPIPSPWAGNYGAAVTVTLRTLTPGATLRYTTDGSTPTASTGTIYTGSFVLNNSTIVRTIAYAPGLSDSPVAVHSYDIFVPPTLGTPLAFTGTAAAGPVVNLAWTDNASAETSYRVERRLGISGAWTQIASLPANSTSHSDTTPNPNTEYSYRVYASNGGGNGGYSTEVLLITPGTFTQPGTLNTSQVANASVVLPAQIRNVASTAQTFTLAPVTSSYTGLTSAQPGGPSFDPWTDISGTGTPISEFDPTSGNKDDVLSSALNIGFPFRFFGTNFSQLRVCSNGFLTFDTASGNTAFSNLSLPNTGAPRNMIAFLWDDLFFSSGKSSRAYYRSFDSAGGANPDTFVVQFSNVVLYSDQNGPTATLQVILKKDGTIRCNYLSVQPSNTSYTIGLNNADGTQGLQLALNQNLVSPGFALQMGAGFGITSSPASLLVAAGATGTVQLTISSNGLPLGDNSASMLITSNLPRQPAFSLLVNLSVLASNPAAPTTPVGFSATSPSSSSILLNWSDVATETSYKLERSPNGTSSWAQIAWLGQGTTSYLDSGLAAGTYYYRLRATNSGGDSAYTSTATVSIGTGLQTFRATHGLAANGSQDTATPAGDGTANLLKYAFNMVGNGAGQASALATSNSSVITASGSAGLPLVDVDGTGKLRVTHVRRKSSNNSGISYIVEFSDTLASGTWAVNALATTVVTSIDTTFERVTVTDDIAGGTQRFVRVRVTAP